ncbi:hypothetical protein OROGR_021203 [Orobanche gracilis]
MDQRGRKEHHPSLPPDYVSLAQLQERWLQKQREKKMIEKRKDEQGKIESDASLHENQKQIGRLENYWREKKAGGGHRRGAVESKGKGKEILVVGGLQNGEKNKTEEKRDDRKKDSGKGSNVGKEKPSSEHYKEFNFGDGFDEPKTVLRNETDMRNKGFLSGENSDNGGLKGSTEKISIGKDFKGGIPRNGDNSKRENLVNLYQLKEIKPELALGKKMGDSDTSRNPKEIRRSGKNREGYYRLKADGADVMKDNIVGTKLEKKADDNNLEVCIETHHLNGRDEDKSSDSHRVERKVLNDDYKEVDVNLVLPMESVEIVEKGRGVGNEYRRYRNLRWNNGRRYKGGLAFNDLKVNFDHRMEYPGSVRFEGRWKTKDREESGMMWVKKEDKTGSSGNHVYFSLIRLHIVNKILALVHSCQRRKAHQGHSSSHCMRRKARRAPER